MLPLPGIVFISGLKLLICAFLLGPEVPIVEFLVNSENDSPSLDRSRSSGDSLLKTLIILNLGSSFAGTSLSYALQYLLHQTLERTQV